MKKGLWTCNLAMVFCIAAIVAVCPSASRAEADVESVTVFAAASTTNAVTEIGKLFVERKLGKFVSSFASSSTLAKQIENGAPADVYVSANKKWMDFLEERKMIHPSTRFDLLANRIVLIVPADSNISRITIAAHFELARLMGDGRLAMGDPDHVPAGIYGKQALEKLGVWEGIKAKVARAKDVRAALALVERGESPLGQVYATDAAISSKVRIVGVFPEDSHPPIVYPVALVAGRDTPVAKRFLTFLKGSEARAIFEKYGFSVR